MNAFDFYYLTADHLNIRPEIFVELVGMRLFWCLYILTFCLQSFKIALTSIVFQTFVAMSYPHCIDIFCTHILFQFVFHWNAFTGILANTDAFDVVLNHVLRTACCCIKKPQYSASKPSKYHFR